MVQLILTEEQAEKLRKAQDTVQLCDHAGNILARINPEYNVEFLRELKRRAKQPGPKYSGAQIEARLQAFEAEWQQTGGFDKAYLNEFRKKLDEKDPPQWR